ncbi:hypothetical protein [Xylocopilactobacillus apicola]|uniref:RNA polymerase sigma-70 region 4 domain-containing protein n=1 Tax=Xylocopilactobacillus apicola TaxID=2932184 RepID=A0AAU9DBK5_9LACO|nr:hypothetical protein [Xylocopilactobacillus apicola]BDR58915.1 hypothetical protein XA3_13560 [Xylocopilactobacillus apicola]
MVEEGLQEGAFFPNFWTKQQVDHWLDVFITMRLAIKIELNFDEKNKQFWFSLDQIWDHYFSDRQAFKETALLLGLFGIVVRAEGVQELFSDFEWERDTWVVMDPRPIDLSDHPLLKLKSFNKLSSYQCLFGLVLNQVTLIDEITMDRLLQICHKSHIKVATPVDLLNEKSKINPEKKLILSRLTDLSYIFPIDSHQRINRIFDPIRQKLIINNFAKVGVDYLDELTWDKLKAVYRAPGIGINKQKLIAERILAEISFLMNPDDQEDKKKEFPLTNLFDPAKDKALLKAFDNLGITSLDQITSDSLSKVFKSCHLTSKKMEYVERQLKYFNEERNNSLDLLSPVFLPLLPFSDKLFSYNEGFEISTSNYLARLSSLGATKKNPRIINLAQLGSSFSFRKKKKISDEQLMKLKNIIAKYLPQKFDGLTDELLANTWILLNHLVPGSLDSCLAGFLKDLDERSHIIFTERLMSSKPATLEALGQKWHTTRERVRQIEQKLKRQFIEWWEQSRLTLKFLMETNGEQIELEQYVRPEFSLLINNTILKHNLKLQRLWFTSSDFLDYLESLIDENLKDGFIHDYRDFTEVFDKKHLKLKESTINRLLKRLNYQRSSDETQVIPLKPGNQHGVVKLYCQAFKIEEIKSDQSTYKSINAWSKENLGSPVFSSYHLFQVMLTNRPCFIPIGKGKYKFFEKDNYDLVPFWRAKSLLEEHFSNGYPFVRDVWLYEQLKNDLPSQMTSDEFYQVFQRLFPKEFVYSLGRNNDIFAAGTTPLSIGEQMVTFLKAQTKPTRIKELKQRFGWANYTVQQEVGKNPAIVIDSPNIFWIDLKLAKKLYGAELTKYLNRELAKKPILFTKSVYQFYQDNCAVQVDLTRINSKKALLSFIKYLQLDLDVIGFDFIMRKKSIPNLKRETSELWSNYFSELGENKITLYELKKAILEAGMSERNWNLNYSNYLKKSDLIYVAKDCFVNKNKIIRNSLIDRAVQVRLNELFENRDFVALRSLSGLDFRGLPRIEYSWTPELFAVFAQDFGYRLLVWKNGLFRIPCPVLILPDSDYHSLEELLAAKIKFWVKDSPVEYILYRRAAKAGLVPKRLNRAKQKFPAEFLARHNLKVKDGLISILNQGHQ